MTITRQGIRPVLGRRAVVAPDGGFFIPDTQRQVEKMIEHGMAYGSRANYERAAVKRRLSEMLAQDDVPDEFKNFTPEQLLEYINRQTGGRFTAGEAIPAGSFVNQRMDGALVANKRLIAEAQGQKVCSTKEQLAQSLIYPLKMSEP